MKPAKGEIRETQPGVLGLGTPGLGAPGLRSLVLEG